MRRFASLVTGTSKVGSSHQRCSIKKGVFRNFTKVTGKHLCQSLFFNKVAGLRCATLLKKKLWYRCFPVNFAKFFRTSFFTEHLRVTASEEAKSALMICYKEMCDKFTGQISFFF